VRMTVPLVGRLAPQHLDDGLGGFSSLIGVMFLFFGGIWMILRSRGRNGAVSRRNQRVRRRVTASRWVGSRVRRRIGGEGRLFLVSHAADSSRRRVDVLPRGRAFLSWER